MALFGNKTKEKSALVCIVEGGSVRLGLALLKPHAKPTLMYQVLESASLEEKPTAERLRTLTLAALSRAAEKMVREGLTHSTMRSHRHGHIDELHFVYASPWHISQTKTVTIEDKKPFKLTHKLIGDVVNRETFAMAERYQQAENPSLTDISVIEERITNIALNGYPVENPYDKETPRATLTLFASILEKEFRVAVEETFARYIHAHTLHHHSLPLVLFSGIRDAFAGGRDIAVAITGTEVTDVIYIRNDTLVDTGSFPAGRETLIRAIAKGMGQTTREVASLLNERHLEHLAKETGDRAREALAKAAGTWALGFRKTLFEILGGNGAPQTLFLVGGEEQHSIKRALETEHWGGAMRIAELASTAVKPFCTTGGGIKNPDPRIVFAALYAHKLDV